MTIRPVPAGSSESVRPAAPKESLEELARDVLATGVEVRAPRRWWFGTRALDARQTAEELHKGNPDLTVRQPETTRSLPLKSQDDLTELAVFHQARPASALAQPELGEAVLGLSHAGFELVDQQHSPLGAYGAYNAITDPAHQLGPLTASLGDRDLPVDQGNLAAMSSFYQHDPLGQLELAGYQFFDSQNQRRFAFGDVPPATVGENGESWLEAGGPDLKQRLEAFAVVRQETGSLEMSRQIAGLTAENFASQGAGLVRQSRALPGVLRAADRLATDRLLELAGTLPMDKNATLGWLDLLERRPETRPGAQMGTALVQAHASQETCQAAFALARCQQGQQAAPVLARLVGQLPELSEVALRELARFPDTAPTAGAVATWQPDDPAPFLEELLQDPLGVDLPQLALKHCDEYDRELHQRVLSQLGQSSERARIGAEVLAANQHGDLWPLKTVLSGKEVTTGGEAAKLLRALEGDVKSSDTYSVSQDLENFATVALATLKRFPDTRAAAEKVAAWELQCPYAVVSKLLEKPTDGSPARLKQLSALVTDEPEAQQRMLADLPDRKVTERLFQAAQEPKLKDAVFRAALENPGLKSGQEAARLLKGLTPVMEESYDQPAEAMLEVLRQFPDTRALADQVAGWKADQPYPLVKRMLTEHDPRLIALEVASDDATGQEAILDQLGPPQAKKLWEALETEEARQKVVQVAVRHPEIKSGADLAAFLNEVSRGFAQAEDHRISYDREGLSTFALDELQKFPDTRAAAERVAGWELDSPFEVVGKLLQNPTQASPASLRTLAGSLDDYDQQAQRRVLEQLAPDALPLFDALQPYSGADKVFQAALKKPELKSGAEVAAMALQLDGKLKDNGLSSHEALAEASLTLLESFPDTRDAAARVRAWQPESSYPLVAALWRRPTDASPESLNQIALQADEDDPALHQRILEPMKGTPAADAALELMQKVEGPATHKSLLTAALTHLEARSGAELATMLADVKLDEYDSESSLLAEGILEVLQGQPDTRGAAATVAGWGASDPYPLVQKLLENPTDASPAALRRVAGALADDEQEAQQKLLAWMACDPATRSTGEIAAELYERTGMPEVVRAAMQHPEIKTGAEAATFLAQVAEASKPDDYGYYRDDGEGLAEVALHQLARFPDTRLAAAEVSSWNLTYKLPVVRELLAHPTAKDAAALRQMATAIAAYDTEGQQNLLTHLKADPATEKAASIGLSLLEQTQEDESRALVLKATLDHPEVATGVEAAALLRQACPAQRPDWDTSLALGEAGLKILQEFPDTKPAADRVAGWKATDPYPLFSALLDQPADSSVEALRKVAARAEEDDPLFYQGVLGGLAEPANRDLGQAGIKELDSSAWQAWTGEILASPPLRSGAEAAALIGRVLSKVSDSWGTAEALSRVAGQTLARFPDTAAAAARYQSWGEDSEAGARLRFWLEDPTFANRQDYFQRAAAICAESDQVMQQSLLEELGQEPGLKTTALMARAAQAEVEYDETRHALFQAALELGPVQGTDDVERYFKLTRQHADYEDEKLTELEELYKMSFGLQGRASDTLAEEESRVLVGGVVVKKKENEK